MKAMLLDVIGHKNQSHNYQHHRCLCLDLSGRITTPDRVSYHTGPKPGNRRRVGGGVQIPPLWKIDEWNPMAGKKSE